jgi:hypothetical protein
MLDDVWCEGAALMDIDNKVLLLFGGEDIKFDPPLRRVYLQLLRSAWSGWGIRWAFEGVVDIADYLGLDRLTVRSNREARFDFPPAPAGEWTESIASVRWEDGGMGLYAMGCEADEVIQILEHQPGTHHGERALEIAELLSKHEGAQIACRQESLPRAEMTRGTKAGDRVRLEHCVDQLAVGVKRTWGELPNSEIVSIVSVAGSFIGIQSLYNAAHVALGGCGGDRGRIGGVRFGGRWGRRRGRVRTRRGLSSWVHLQRRR